MIPFKRGEERNERNDEKAIRPVVDTLLYINIQFYLQVENLEQKKMRFIHMSMASPLNKLIFLLLLY